MRWARLSLSRRVPLLPASLSWGERTCRWVPVGAGVPSCEGRMGDEAAGAAKTRNVVGGCLHSGDYDQKCSLMLSGNFSRLEYKFHKGFHQWKFEPCSYKYSRCSTLKYSPRLGWLGSFMEPDCLSWKLIWLCFENNSFYFYKLTK